MIVTACSGSSGCSGCSSCGGITPLPAGFDPASRIENAASVRLTDSGLKFIQNNLGTLASKLLQGQGTVQNGVITFPVPESKGSGTGYSYVICKGGPDPQKSKCIAEIDIGNAKIGFATGKPHELLASGPVPIRIKNLPIEVTLIGFIPISSNAVISGGGDSDCNMSTMTFKNVNVTGDISIEVERDQKHTSRLGYSKIKVVKFQIDQNQVLDGLHFCPANFSSTILNWLVPLLGNMLMSGFTDTIVSTINDQLCLKPDKNLTPPCPAGSDEKSGKCMYADNSCVSIMLGMDGHMDLGAALSSFSPGTSGGLDFLFAVGGQSARPDDATQGWGDLNPVANGATLGMFGGALPVPVSECVPKATLTLPTGIPIPDELMGNTIAGWSGEGPHMGIALSERFSNYALGAAYNSGVLCIGVGTEQVAQLSTGLFSLLVFSIKSLTYQKKPAPLAVVVRPQKPPTAVFGNGTDMVKDPLIRVKLDQAMIDFYVWSSDRFIRAFTAQFDLDVPVGLDITADGKLQPKLDKIYVNNAKVTNSELLSEAPDKIAKSLSDVITGMAGQFLGAIKPIDISSSLSSLGLTLVLQKSGLRKLTSGSDNFLGVFAALGIAPQTTPIQSKTSAGIEAKLGAREGFALATHTIENAPRVLVRAGSQLDDGSRAVEYSYKLDQGYWHVWTRDRRIVVDDPFLMMQGRHRIYVTSRLVDQPATEDPQPAVVEVTLDVEAPRVSIAREGDALRVEASDAVSGADAVKVRYRFDDGAPTQWVSLGSLERITPPSGAKLVVVEAVDEEGNIGRTQQALIRGRPDKSLNPGGSSSCGCSVPGSGGGESLRFGAAALLGALGIVLRRARARRRAHAMAHAVGSAAVLALFGSWTGCSCGSQDEAGEPGAPASTDQDAGADAAEVAPPEDGEAGCTGPGCLEALLPGLIGSYTSAAAAADGTIWISGYEEADWDNGNLYGDLVVGKWDPTSKKVAWELVDGVPTTPEPDGTYDPFGWRGGQTAAGDDVGLWTSLAIDTAGNPMVAYYDVTHTSLKLARYDGKAWTSAFVYQKTGVEAGRYAKLVVVSGKPVVAFQAIEVAAANAAPKSKVLLARAKSATPAGPTDWNVEEVAVELATPCRERLCPKGDKCLLSTLKCATTATSCNPACASGKACVAGKCEDIIDGTKLDSYPDAIGDYVALAVGPQDALGIVYYDRPHGNLVGARQDKGAWQKAILDGQTATTPPTDTGDVGIGASLAIGANGDWHVAYVDGFKESLRYMLVKGGTTPQPAETVDNGLGLGGQKFADGLHMVGDDSNITLTKANEVRIAYQDATAGKLRFAIGTPGSGSGHTWKLSVVEVDKGPPGCQGGFAGFFAQQVTANSATQLVTWWRKLDKEKKTLGEVCVVQP
jgi:hypothetical protein